MALKDVQHIASGALQKGFQPPERYSGKRIPRVYLVNVCERCSHRVWRGHQQGVIWSGLEENPAIREIAADCLCRHALTGARKAINKQDMRAQDGRLHRDAPDHTISPTFPSTGAVLHKSPIARLRQNRNLMHSAARTLRFRRSARQRITGAIVRAAGSQYAAGAQSGHLGLARPEATEDLGIVLAELGSDAA